MFVVARETKKSGNCCGGRSSIASKCAFSLQNRYQIAERSEAKVKRRTKKVKKISMAIIDLHLRISAAIVAAEAAAVAALPE